MTREEEIRDFIEKQIIYKDSRVVTMLKEAAVLGMTWADAHPKKTWRDAKTDLPDKLNKFFSDFVLVMYTRGGKHYPFITRYDYECRMWEIDNVTHWMPIPELTKGGDE